MSDAVKQRLRAFVMKNFYLPDAESFVEASSLLDRGVIDSTGVLELVAFVENEYGLAVADDDIVPTNFDSINALAAFIARKKA